MDPNEKIAKLIRETGKPRNQLHGNFVPGVSDDGRSARSIVKTAEEAEGPKPDTKPMEGFSAQKVIEAVNSATTLDEKIKAYSTASGYTNLDLKKD